MIMEHIHKLNLKYIKSYHNLFDGKSYIFVKYQI